MANETAVIAFEHYKFKKINVAYKILINSSTQCATALQCHLQEKIRVLLVTKLFRLKSFKLHSFGFSFFSHSLRLLTKVCTSPTRLFLLMKGENSVNFKKYV